MSMLAHQKIGFGVGGEPMNLVKKISSVYFEIEMKPIHFRSKVKVTYNDVGLFY